MSPIAIADDNGGGLMPISASLTGMCAKLRALASPDLLTAKSIWLVKSWRVIDQTTGEILAPVNQEITEELIEALSRENTSEIQTLYINDVDHGSYISCPAFRYVRFKNLLP